jgi:hypothetical protein
VAVAAVLAVAALSGCGGGDTDVATGASPEGGSAEAITTVTGGAGGPTTTAVATSEPTVGDVLQAQSVPCGSVPAAPSGPLRAEVLLANTQIALGGSTAARVNLRNTGAESLAVGDGSPLEALLVRAGSGEILSRQRLEVEAGTAGNPEEPLQPGGSLTLPVLVGTQRCDAAPGEFVPAGSYDLIVLVTGTGGQMVPSAPVKLDVSA